MKYIRIPVFALFIWIYPILYLYSRNLIFIPAQYIFRSVASAGSISIILTLLFYLITRKAEKAGLLTSLVGMIFFAYGHLINIGNGLGFTTPRDVNPIVLWISLIVFLIASLLIARSKFSKNALVYLNSFGLLLILLPVWTIISAWISLSAVNIERAEKELSQTRAENAAESTITGLAELEKPDIYMIILDSYERADILKEHYHYDNQAFIQQLQDRGFYVADGAHSNYLNTTYSVNTLMNLVYFHDFPKSLMKSAGYNLQTNYVSDFLREQGYQIVVFDSGTGDTNNQYADQFLTPVSASAQSRSGINPFETLLIQTTAIQALFSANSGGGAANANLAANVDKDLDVRRSRIQYAFEHLPDFAQDGAPQLVFAHIYAPHIPFLYDETGAPLRYADNNKLTWYAVDPADYVEKYAHQLDHLNRQVIQAVDRIIQNASRPVVIVLLSDHGDDYYLDWAHPTRTGIEIRSSVFYSIYYSSGTYEHFYPTITSVNTFRVVLNDWFGTSYPLLEDRVMFHPHSGSRKVGGVPAFTDACEKYDVCLTSEANMASKRPGGD